ncbi:hypothetical protein Tco_0769941 [Tanacetum coccineum]|uniref:Uncharacterized protein n=1 Tax=Tanacetum coccineum TaxID=301880 RepID=A0ABQ4ZBS1_9ASTR
MSTSKSAQAEEPIHANEDLEEPAHHEFDTGFTEDQPVDETTQHLIARNEDPRESFNELMDTPLDFSAFVMNRLKVDTLTPELLAVPTYELMKGSCKSLVELEYFLEEVCKATTDQLDWNNPEGQKYPHDLRKPLPLIPNSRGRQVIPFDHFINNDLAYLSGGVSSRTYATSVTKIKAADYGHIKWIKDFIPNSMWINRESARDVYSKHRILAVTKLKIVKWHNYKHLDWITVRRNDDKLYTFKEGDYNRLRIQDIEDMLLLLVQGKLTNLNVEERLALGVSLRMFTRSIILRRPWESFGEIKDALMDKQNRQDDIQELISKLLEDMQNISEELSEYIYCPSWNRPLFYFDDDDDEYTVIWRRPKAISPDEPSEEPEDPLIIGEKELSTIPEKDKSSVEDLDPIPSGSKGISDDICDNSDAESLVSQDISITSSKIDFLSEDFTGEFTSITPGMDEDEFDEEEVDCYNHDISSDDDSYENIEYVEASLLKLEYDNLEEENEDQEEKDDSFFEESDTSLSHSYNSLPEFKTFSDHAKETKSGSTTTHANNSLPEEDTLDDEKAQERWDFTLLTLTKKEQGVSITDCHAGNPCEISSDLTDENDLPMIGILYGYDQEERVTEMRTRRFT